MSEPSKQERYFSGMPLAPPDPSKPLPGETPPGMRENFIKAGIAVAIFSVGVMAGMALSPETPTEAQGRITELEGKLAAAREKIGELNRSLAYNPVAAKAVDGMLSAKDRQRHEQYGARYVAALRKQQAQSAADLVDWFIRRWDDILDKPEPEDRTDRRARLLSQLVGAMAKTLHPGDYVAWQAEFFNGNWLGELHFDLDGDGLPGKRSRPNTNDGFTQRSVCDVAMALNQAVTDAQILVTPDMRCDSPNANISVFLPGRTMDDALTQLVNALKGEGFLIKENLQQGVRLILISPKPGS